MEALIHVVPCIEVASQYALEGLPKQLFDHFSGTGVLAFATQYCLFLCIPYQSRLDDQSRPPVCCASGAVERGREPRHGREDGKRTWVTAWSVAVIPAEPVPLDTSPRERSRGDVSVCCFVPSGSSSLLRPSLLYMKLRACPYYTMEPKTSEEAESYGSFLIICQGFCQNWSEP
jgi:hypothetical protein